MEDHFWFEDSEGFLLLIFTYPAWCLQMSDGPDPAPVTLTVFWLTLSSQGWVLVTLGGSYKISALVSPRSRLTLITGQLRILPNPGNMSQVSQVGHWHTLNSFFKVMMINSNTGTKVFYSILFKGQQLLSGEANSTQDLMNGRSIVIVFLWMNKIANISKSIYPRIA